MLLINKKKLASAVSLFILFIVALPLLSSAAASTTGLVKCGIADDKGVITNPCDFKDFIILINDIINWIIGISVSIFTI